MPEPDDFDDDDFPVLNNVVKAGDPAVIRAARATQDAIQRPATLRTSSPALTPAALSRSITTPPNSRFTTAGSERKSGNTVSNALGDRQIEKLIDEIIDRHSEEMRREIRSLLSKRD